MINKQHQKKIITALKKTEFGLNLSELKRNLGLTKDQVRISISFLLGANKVEERAYGMNKIYSITKLYNNFMGDKD